MRVDPPLAGVNLGRVKLAQRDPAVCFHVVQVRLLIARDGVRLRVVENPIPSRQIREVSSGMQLSEPDDFEGAPCFVFE